MCSHTLGLNHNGIERFESIPSQQLTYGPLRWWEQLGCSLALPGLFAGNQARPIAPVTASRVYFLTVDHDDSIHSMYIYIWVWWFSDSKCIRHLWTSKVPLSVAECFCRGQRYVKAFARRSVAYEELQKWHDAFEDLKKSVELDPSLRAKDLWQNKIASFLCAVNFQVKLFLAPSGLLPEKKRIHKLYRSCKELAA